MYHSHQMYEIFCYSDSMYVAFISEKFDFAVLNDFEDIEHLRIDMGVLAAIDSGKLVELMDMGIIVSVRGESITPQEVVEALGFEDICTYDSESKKADSVKLYKDGEGYVCEKGGYDFKITDENKRSVIETD